MLTLLPLVLFAADFMDFCVPGSAPLPSATDAEVIRRAMASGAGRHTARRRGWELKAIRQAELDAMRDEWRAKLYSGEISVWSLFEDYAMLGDSRTSGFTYYGYLALSACSPTPARPSKKVIDHLEELVALNPSIIFLTYGINDVGIGYWPRQRIYVNEINNTLALLKEHLPNATVYVCSIIPALEPAFKRAPHGGRSRLQRRRARLLRGKWHAVRGHYAALRRTHGSLSGRRRAPAGRLLPALGYRTDC